MSDDVSADPSAAFAVLADPTRIEILRALAADPLESVSFSELRERVGTADSGQFNYHLGKLVGRFASKSETGYQLTTAGFQIYGAILAGTYSGTVEFDPFPLTEDCPDCGAGLEARYEDEKLRIVCPECGHLEVLFAFPPGAFADRSPEELLSTLNDRLRAMLLLAQRGTCPICWGRMDKRLAVDSNADDANERVIVSITCDRCGEEIQTLPGALLLSEPAVIAAYHEAGIDLRERPNWSLPWLSEQAHETLSTDPLRVTVRVDVGPETLLATVESDATVSAIERER